MRTRQALASMTLGSDTTSYGVDQQPDLSTELVWPEAIYFCSRKDQDCSRVWDVASHVAGVQKSCCVLRWWGRWFLREPASYFCNDWFLPHLNGLSTMPRLAF